MKMFLEIVRRQSTDFGTPGKATLYDETHTETGFSMDTLELPWKQNRSGVSCIKAGSYLATRVTSDHFKRPLWRLEDKNGRQACEIHNGNLAGDIDKTLHTHTGRLIHEQTQVHGCTLTGRGYGEVQLGNEDATQYGILNSKMVLNEFMEATEQADNDGLLVTYRWAEGCQPDDDN